MTLKPIDHRTGLCFLIGSSGHALWISNVECTESVLSPAAVSPTSSSCK